MVVIGVLSLLFLYGKSLFDNKLNLICTGREKYENMHVDSPYSFNASFNLDRNEFSLELLENADNKHKLYPRDNPWGENNKQCPTPFWKLEISDTEIHVVLACNKEDYLKSIFWAWMFNRMDGTFYKLNGTFPLLDKDVKGQCIKESEKAF